ncbi:M28 family peptidase [candidate division CSSED10-310 bacterium]|uniref:M28 family peptidase n=1 Tax=candidate division CSSED10-310 bacterium TaxID=2855610 RepID=A0ABV6Z5U2_UNCC1
MIGQKIIYSLLCLVLAVSIVLWSCSDDDDDDQTMGMLESALDIEAIMAHLEQLELIAQGNNGHRAAGSSGYDQSVSYIRETLSNTDFIITEQEVQVRYFEETAPPVLEMISPENTSYTWGTDYVTLSYSGSGDVHSEIVFIDPMIPPGETDNSSTDGCEEEDFQNIDLTGKIAVIQRGSCYYHIKATYAEQNGASAVLIFNEGQAGRQEVISATLTAGSEVTIPVLGLSYNLGYKLYTLTQTGQTVEMHVTVTALDEWTVASNIFAETASGNDDQVIILGAHLDSVTAGPGINDDGSGSAALLELAYQIASLGYKPVNKITFAWWTAEEDGLLGSEYFLADLLANNPAALGRIAMYLNFDMIASPNYIRGVQDSDQSVIDSGFEQTPPGSGDLEQSFLDYFQARDLPTVPVGISRSDDVSFFNYGIPSSALATGSAGLKSQNEVALFGGTAGEPYDPCWHRACDTTDNIDQEILLQNAQAIASVLESYGDIQGPLFDTRTAVSPGAMSPSHAGHYHALPLE